MSYESLNAHSATDLWGKGKYQAELGNYEEAIRIYNLALYYAPAYAEVYNSKGQALYMLEQYEDALEAYNKAIEINQLRGGKFGRAWWGKGQALYMLGKYERAVAAYDMALQDENAKKFNVDFEYNVLEDKEKALEKLVE